MKFRLVIFAISSFLLFSNCGNGNDSVVGNWKEYRADGDNSYISKYKFNSDGSGLFTVNGFTNTQKISFTWEKVNSSTLQLTMNGEISYLELSNGLLIEG